MNRWSELNKKTFRNKMHWGKVFKQYIINAVSKWRCKKELCKSNAKKKCRD